MSNARAEFFFMFYFTRILLCPVEVRPVVCFVGEGEEIGENLRIFCAQAARKLLLLKGFWRITLKELEVVPPAGLGINSRPFHINDKNVKCHFTTAGNKKCLCRCHASLVSCSHASICHDVLPSYVMLRFSCSFCPSVIFYSVICQNVGTL